MTHVVVNSRYFWKFESTRGVRERGRELEILEEFQILLDSRLIGDGPVDPEVLDPGQTLTHLFFVREVTRSHFPRIEPGREDLRAGT